jgi:hypothetical protein
VHDPAWADVGETAASVTVKILPAIVTVPLRGAGAVGSHANLHRAAARPRAAGRDGDRRVARAVRLHPLVAVTAMLADPPEDVKLVEAGDRL